MPQGFEAEWTDIAAKLQTGWGFEAVETHIDQLDLTDEQKSVLWLWAWSELPRLERRRIVPPPGVVERVCVSDPP